MGRKAAQEIADN